MNLDYSADDNEFRLKARRWLERHVPKEPRPGDVAAAGRYDRAWQRTLHDHGWAGVNWPREFGGLGLASTRQMIWFEECARARAPAMNSMLIALMHGGPTLIARGSDQQKAFHLPQILKESRSGAKVSRSQVRVPTSPHCKPAGLSTVTIWS